MNFIVTHILSINFWLTIAPIIAALGSIASAIAVWIYSRGSHKIQKEIETRDKRRYTRENRKLYNGVYLATLKTTEAIKYIHETAKQENAMCMIPENFSPTYHLFIDEYFRIKIYLRAEEQTLFDNILCEIKKLSPECEDCLPNTYLLVDLPENILPITSQLLKLLESAQEIIESSTR